MMEVTEVTTGEADDGMDTTDETMEEAGVTTTAGADVEMGNAGTDDAPTVTVTVEKMMAVTVVTPPAGVVEAGAGAAVTELMIVTGWGVDTTAGEVAEIDAETEVLTVTVVCGSTLTAGVSTATTEVVSGTGTIATEVSPNWRLL
ncbi:hypothetical protein PLEOSDRAFT_1090965, partial [Pleurotus ostreatus PC15]